MLVLHLSLTFTSHCPCPSQACLPNVSEGGAFDLFDGALDGLGDVIELRHPLPAGHVAEVGPPPVVVLQPCVCHLLSDSSQHQLTSWHTMFIYSLTAKTILRNNFRTEWRHRLDIVTEEDSIHQLDRAAQVALFKLRTGLLSTPLPPPRAEHFTFRRMSMRYRSLTSQPHPAVLHHLRGFETPDMAQSGGCPQEALGTSLDTAADCGLRLTHQTEDLA